MRRWTGTGLLSVMLGSGVAWAQSPETLEAVRLHRAGARELAHKDLEACAASKCPDAGRIALLAGTLALAEGDVTEARTLLTGASVSEPLQPYLAYYLGQAHFYSGDAAQAAVAFAKAMEKASPALASRTRARLGEALLAAGKAKEAAPVLEVAAKEEPSAELLYQRAQTRKAMGNATGEREDLKAVALRYPAHPYADEALAMLEATKPPLRLTLAEHLQRARGLLDAGAPKRVLEELEKAESRKLARTKQDKAQVALVRAQALYSTGKKEEAEQALAVARQGPPSVAAEAAYVTARRALKADDNVKAREQMAAIEKTWPKEDVADEAGFYVGWLDLQAGRFEDAVKSFKAFDQRHTGSRRRDEAMWYRALAHIRMEQYGPAREVLDTLADTFPRSSLVPQARYWSARSHELEGAGADVTGPGYESVIATAPNSYYALLATERLRELGKEPPAAFPEAPKQLEAAGVLPELKLAVALTEAGLFSDAAEEVQARSARIRGQDQALTFAQALLRLGEYGHAHAVAARYLWGRAFGARAPEALAAFYPRAFANAVESEASRYKVSPFLVWAIMRRESAFRPEVASAADARGLMQVIPPTARAIAKKLSEPEPAPAELFSPSLSIRYGAWYLSQLMKRFSHPALAAAAYNAGPDAAVKWVQQKGSLPLDLFVEEIPFRETRGYVKQVLADLYLYQSFYGKDAAPQRLSLTVPAPNVEGVSF
ncbi:transglycosylase SLT domain-containing protein [Vitiosangium sp. GDMCC 1.1324]|uniref:transglycosylase SLT domain-containing protein n=1 Tax=Vitiosangium sp. (strain GDMCC 1.1324) TaxID=2138576 RepID=UPI000D3B8FE7|nr:transglycosylase SLT domain-containing protein [Vitiosangium sp. GDMCC 1.1324]PTL76845.1 lytic transglycosylase [Vitiosangium sp. GDMCC 1.1324]